MLLLVAVTGEGQVAFEVSTTLTIWPLTQVALVKVLLVVGAPWLTPFICHWYKGLAPPFTGVAVKVTDVLLQTEVAVAPILTAGTTSGLTVIVTVLDVAGLPVAQGSAFEVSTT
jgi:hypothetical protein